MFIGIGLVGLALLVLAFVFDDVFDGLLPGGDWLSTTSLAAFGAAFGFGASMLQIGANLNTGPAAVGGVACGLALGTIAVRWSRSLSNMATDATPNSSDLVGLAGQVVTPIPTDSSGEVLVTLGGQPVKLSAVGREGADELGRGDDIVVVDVLSATRVRVEIANDFWG